MKQKPVAAPDRCALLGQLGIVDQALGFQLLILAAVLLSYFSVLIQRRGLCLTLCGDEGGAAALPPIFPIKVRAAAIVVGCLGFFLCLARATLEGAERGGDPVAKGSARTNFVASLLVLVASILRLMDLNFVEANQPQLAAAEILPE